MRQGRLVIQNKSPSYLLTYLPTYLVTYLLTIIYAKSINNILFSEILGIIIIMTSRLGVK